MNTFKKYVKVLLLITMVVMAVSFKVNMEAASTNVPRTLVGITLTTATPKIFGPNVIGDPVVVTAKYSDNTTAVQTSLYDYNTTGKVYFWSDNYKIIDFVNGRLKSGPTPVKVPTNVTITANWYEGNLDKEGTCVVTVMPSGDIYGPDLSVKPAGGKIAAGININIDITDYNKGGSGISSYTYNWDNQGSVTSVNKSAAPGWNLSTGCQAPKTGGQHTLHFTAYDTANNKTTMDYVYTVDASVQKLLTGLTLTPEKSEIVGANTFGQPLIVTAKYSDNTTEVIKSGVTFDLSDKSFATLENGRIKSGATAVTKPRDEVITATYTEFGVTKTARCVVTVKAGPAPMAPTISHSGNINTSNMKAYKISGNTSPNAKVHISFDYDWPSWATTTVFADDSGTYSTTLNVEPFSDFSVGDGNVTIYARATGVDGQVSTITKATVFKDTFSPGMSDFGGDYLAGVNIVISVGDNGNSNVTSQYSWDNGNYVQVNKMTFTIKVPENLGQHILNVKSIDAAGNTTEINRKINVVNTINNVPITMTVSPMGTDIQVGSTLKVTVTAARPLAASQYYWDNGAVVRVTNPASFEVKVPTTLGRHILYIGSKDIIYKDIGNFTTGRPFEFNVVESTPELVLSDTVPPASPIFSINPTTPSTKAQITIDYSSDSTVKMYKIGSSDTYKNYSGPVAVYDNSVVYALAQDTAGNKVESQYSVTTIDKTAPTISSTVPINGAVITDTSSSITITLSESVKDISFNDVQISDETGNVVSKTGTKGERSFILKPTNKLLPNKRYSVKIPASAVQDLAGNTLTQSYTFSFSTAPALEVLSSITVIPTESEIIGSNVMGQALQTTAVYDDNTTVVKTSGVEYTSSNSALVSVEGGKLKSGSTAVTDATKVTITATYTEGGVTKLATFIVTVKPLNTTKDNSTAPPQDTIKDNLTATVPQDSTKDSSSPKDDSKDKTINNPVVQPTDENSDGLAVTEASVESGKFDKKFSVKITNKKDYPKGTKIYYTLDGSEPRPDNNASKKWTSSVSIKQTSTLKAVAVLGGQVSEVAEYKYTIVPKAPKVTPSVKKGTYTKTIKVKFSKSGYKKDTEFYYTLDGTDPTEDSEQWDGSYIVIDKTTTLKAIAVYDGESSDIATFKYNFATLANTSTGN